MGALAGVVIPAHNEEARILRTLDVLHSGLDGDRLEVVVVCNGCTDHTAAVVRDAHPEVRVIEIPEPTRTGAVAVGDAACDTFPRLHLDADVRVSGTSVRAMVTGLEEDGVLAVGPARALDRRATSALVRWYYDVWERLPQVRTGLFGRGAFMLSEEGQERVTALPPLMSDDLAASEAFAPEERRVVADARAVVRPPRTLGDLLQRRVRVATGNAQATAAFARSAASVTSLRMLWEMVRGEPRMAWRIPVFLGVAALARLRARWMMRSRDRTPRLSKESSRA